MRIALLLVLAVGCSRKPAVSREEVARRAVQAIHANKLEGIVRLQGDDLIHSEREGEMKFSLKTGYGICATSADKCDLYLDRVMGVFKGSIEGDDDDEEPRRSSSATHP